GGAEDEGMGYFGRITKLSDLPGNKSLMGTIKKAVALNEAGIKKTTPPRSKVKKDLVIPDYFSAALAKNKKAKNTFEDFSYSHKKEYVQWLAEAKREETREQRIKT